MSISHLFLPLVLVIQSETPIARSDCDISLPVATGLPENLRDAEFGGRKFSWVGSPELAARVPADGVWIGMGPENEFGDKWWWWRDGYEAKTEPSPELIISASRLDASGQSEQPFVTSAYGPGWNMILVGMRFPSAGCWTIEANYHGKLLEFTFQVGE